ncbi:hypothetical protein KO500_13290 [Cellulophaga baltica]|uniref:hypothetical protein n=1 Tax=Cellulophaga TaxID=104264 RepID=UPI001C073C9B|nr:MULTISPECIES: hypothetical protein [Cellulophaga]MBU2997416.1 hypothetical protein [Cellulophaga baltica]MDO6768813.1 hypothetical protein [Cellulophaga sp. 1_MG-2023]
MELNSIEKLLEKYFEATTTVAEEKILQAYFSNENVVPHLEKYKSLFAHFANAKQEQFIKQIPLNTSESKKNRKWMSVAAVAVVLLGIYFGNNYIEQKKAEQAQAEYAYEQTKKALSLLAVNFNKGTEKVAYLKEFEETKQKIYNK